MPCIDIHHHYFPPDLQATKNRSNVALGWQTPPGHLEWSPEVSLRGMDELGIDISILSYPAISHGCVGEDNREAARARNTFASEVCKKYPSRFGFFACLPFLDDIKGCLEEISFALDNLLADGISLASSYGEGQDANYIGHDKYEPIWAELNRRKAVVFLHGAQTPSSTPYPHPYLGVPITEVPNETYKAAAHLVVSGRKRQYPSVRIILAHMGGTLPSMAARTAVLANYMGCEMSVDDILKDFRTFWFDTALAACGPALQQLESFLKGGKGSSEEGVGKLLFGSDFPAVDAETISWFSNQVVEYYASNEERMREIMYRNALELFPNRQVALKIEK